MTKSVEACRQALAEARVAADAAQRAAQSVMGDDPAVVSGVRRKPNQRADRRRYAVYGRAAEAAAAVRRAEADLAIAEQRAAREQRDAAAHRDVVNIEVGDLVRDRSGWHRVVRVSAKSVSVETAWSWTDRIELSRIIETRKPSLGRAS